MSARTEVTLSQTAHPVRLTVTFILTCTLEKISCHISLWSSAETIFKKQQNAIFSDSKTKVIPYMLKTHIVKSM